MINKLRNTLKKECIDYLLINTTDEFLVEYNELSNCARYKITGFTGSTGDALLSKDNLWQFVDGRYHEQADNEVNDKTTVVKLQLGETFTDKLIEKIEPQSTLGVVSSKISLNFYKILKTKLSKKHCKIKALEYEPVEQFTTLRTIDSDQNIEPISIEIAGLSTTEKLNKISKKLKTNEAYLETNLENIAYITNSRQYKTPFSSTFKAKLLITKHQTFIYTNECINSKIGEEFTILPTDKLKKNIKNYKKIFFNPQTINYMDYKTIQKCSVELKSDLIKEMKAIKNQAEIRHFKNNFERTDKVVNKIFELIQSNKEYTEKDLSDITEQEYLKQGAKQLSFKTILAAGPNSSIIHYSTPSDKQTIQNGDFVLIDCGGHFEGGYSTDITRTFCKGKPSNLQRKVYTTVLKMFLNAYNKKITSRTSGYTLDKIARNIHKKSGLKDFNFNHGLGHGVGISVHENPPTISCSKIGKRILKENMVFTIEPGLYKAGFGGVRLENTVYLMRENGELRIKSFSKVPFQNDLIDYNLLNEQEIAWLKNWQEEKC